MQSLRHRYEERVNRARTTLANKYRTNAEESLAAGDPVAAANAFRVALTLSPNDSELAQSATAAQAQADGILSATYARQAGYEEKNGQWVDAARSWARVVRACPKADGNLHEAARLAQRACSMDPGNPAFHVTLANVYVAAGLTLNARRELETAAQLSPHDATIDALFRRIGKREGRQVPGL
jgi:Flp pilus assembly protein TadD